MNHYSYYRYVGNKRVELTPATQEILQAIKNAGEKGVTILELQKSTSYARSTISGSLPHLEGKALIKKLKTSSGLRIYPNNLK